MWYYPVPAAPNPIQTAGYYPGYYPNYYTGYNPGYYPTYPMGYYPGYPTMPANPMPAYPWGMPAYGY
jgi:hypothetical protein